MHNCSQLLYNYLTIYLLTGSRRKCGNLAFCPAGSESTRRTALRKTTVRFLQKAFSHRASLCRLKPDLAEKLKGNGTRFSWECAFLVLHPALMWRRFVNPQRHRHVEAVIIPRLYLYLDVRPPGTRIRVDISVSKGMDEHSLTKLSCMT